ncbi:MAG: hypothetical protein ACXWX1_10690 [Aeromicrobium sp.]
MAEVMPSQLMNSVLGKFYDILTNGDDTVPPSEDNFFSWATPGIPVDATEFDFLTQGLTGVVKKEAIAELAAPVPVPAGGGEAPAPSGGVELTPALLEQLRATDTAQLYQEAENFARLVDFVPDVASATNDGMARLAVMNNEGGLSDIYQYTLRMSQVAQTELPQETKDKIEKFRQLLTTSVKKKNLIDDSETEVLEPSTLTKSYNEKLAAYEDAALQYNSRRIDALTASDSAAVHFWGMNANILRNRVKAAMADWVSAGYKNDYEAIAAFIDQVMQRDMALLKQQYRDDLEKARLTGLASGSDFFYTSLAPGNFAKSGGWTKFTFSSSSFDSQVNTSYSTKQWKAEAHGGFMGIFGGGGGGGASESKNEYNSTFKSDRFNLSFEIAQLPIIRDWLKLAYLLSRSWRFDQNNPEAKGEVISDGAKPPKGKMPAIPTSIIFVRNLVLDFGEATGFTDFVAQNSSSSAEVGGSASWGPFSLGGSYSRSSASGSTNRHQGFETSSQGISVNGMQIAGFKCHVLPKSPDPLSTIEKWI